MIVAARKPFDEIKTMVKGYQNSAIKAGLMAEEFKMPLTDGLQMVQVPCTGKVDMDYILTAFEEGADGVLVLGCHGGN